jgi:hypothetical protein
MIPMHSVSFDVTYIHPENQENSRLKIHHFFTLKFTLYIHQQQSENHTHEITGVSHCKLW